MIFLKKLLLISFLISLTSCSSYVNRVHQQLDREYMQQQGIDPDKQGPPSAQFLREQSRGQRPEQVNSQNTRFQSPQVQRNYQSQNPNRSAASQGRRVQAQDLRDNTPSTSLWANSESQLFSQSRSHEPGDIVLINVLDRLKNEITLELRRSFPPQRRQQNRNNEENNNQEEEANNRDVANDDGEKRIHDRISSVIIEQVSRDHVLLRGRKNVLYRGSQRLVEVQALISKRDINDNDAILSDDIIESQVTVLR